ncbi:ATP-binding response regulator [Anaeromyxobacter oryzae]|uniref:histidine kinase n=1 Tax=Anaeromyxobacter oryzae TaxID=2918170 RepID=A0ABN6MZX7_9BACT|nr:ATP-binding protein [Anaeromyxobacter oryzae]BDG06226.1 hypothetical protein AMOR_52220 [Anaeromyxobacter oryzae]
MHPGPAHSGRSFALALPAAKAVAALAGLLAVAGLAILLVGDGRALAAGVALAGAAGIGFLGGWIPSRARRRREVATLAALREELEATRRSAEGERQLLVEAERQARDAAERADRAKDEFVATVSHELRTPLNAVLGWARLLRLGKLDATATARAVETIERSASAQAQIVDDLLDVSRIVRGQLRLDVRPVDLVPVIEAAIDAVRPAAVAREIGIAAVLMPRAGPVAGDPGRLQQVVWNLLANGIKFTKRGGRVEVRLDQEGDAVAIRVKDTGAGIDSAFLPHVFERFRQADSSSTRAHGGLGLGLAIVRHLVEAHGGTVAAASDGPGRGATFTVRLPLLVPKPHRARDVAGSLPVVDAAAPLAALARVRVLVVDDDPDTVEVVRQVLEQAGAQVVAAASAREAIEAFAARPPDVVLSDLGMPGEDGYALIARIRALEAARGGDVPAAALTAYTQGDERRRALEAGYQLYLAKPVEPSALTAAIARLAGRLS